MCPLSRVVLTSVPPLRRVTFEKSAKVTKALLLLAWPSSVGFPHSGDAPWARRHRPSMAGGASAASMPRCPLRATCVRPAPKSRFAVFGLTWKKNKSESESENKGKGKGKGRTVLLLLIVPYAPRGNAAQDAPRPMTRSVVRGDTTLRVGAISLRPCRDFTSATNCDFGRPSAGIAQPGARHGCRASAARAWMPVRRVPAEQCRSEGTPTKEGPDTGAKRFGYFAKTK